MTPSEFKRRLEKLATHYQPDAEPIQIRMCVMHFVEQGDPRLGTWTMEEGASSSAVVMDFVNFYAADLAHFNEMKDQFGKLQDQLLFETKPAVSNITLTNLPDKRK